jgi:hypothetical protein
LQPPHLLWKCGCNVWVSVVVENTKVCHEDQEAPRCTESYVNSLLRQRTFLSRLWLQSPWCYVGHAN